MSTSVEYNNKIPKAQLTRRSVDIIDSLRFLAIITQINKACDRCIGVSRDVAPKESEDKIIGQ